MDGVRRRWPGSIGPDAYSREISIGDPVAVRAVGIVDEMDRPHFDPEAEAAWDTSIERLRAMGLELVAVPMQAFREVAALLYDGVRSFAERLATLAPFLARAGAEALLPVTHGIIAGGGGRHSAADAFRGLHRLAELRRETEAVWTRIDALAVPTAPLFPTLDRGRGRSAGAECAARHFYQLRPICSAWQPSRCRGRIGRTGCPRASRSSAPAGRMRHWQASARGSWRRRERDHRDRGGPAPTCQACR